MIRRVLTVSLLLIAGWAMSVARAQIVLPGPPSANSISVVTVTCGTTSTPFNVNGTNFLIINMPSTAGTVWFAWGSTAATTAAPSFAYTGANTIMWGGGSGSCIVASGTQAISVGHN